MKNEARRQIALDDISHATSAGFEGVAMDPSLESRPRDFSFGDVKQPVFVWHGTEDDTVPVEAAHGLHQALGGSGRRSLLNVSI